MISLPHRKRMNLGSKCILGLLFWVNFHLYGQIYKPDAISVGLGGSAITATRTPSALFWNPALLSQLRDQSLIVNSDDPFALNFVAYNHFFPGYGTFAAGFMRQETGSDTSKQALLGWSFQRSDRLSFGTNISLQWQQNSFSIKNNIGVFWGEGQVGGFGQPWSRSKSIYRFNLGMVLQNVPIIVDSLDFGLLVGGNYIFPTNGIILNAGYHIGARKNTTHLGIGFELTNDIKLFAGARNLSPKNIAFGFAYNRKDYGIQVGYDIGRRDLVVSFLTRLSQPPGQMSVGYFNAGAEAMNSGDYFTANSEYKKYLAYWPTDADSDSIKQLTYSLDRRLARTESRVDSLLAAANKLLSGDQPQFLQAAFFLSRVLELHPKNTLAKNQLSVLKPVIAGYLRQSLDNGVVKFENGEYERAQRAFERVVVFEPDNPTALYYLSGINDIFIAVGEKHFQQGMQQYQRENYPAAVQGFSKAIKYNPESIAAQSYLAKTISRMQEKASEIDGLLVRGQAYEKSSRYVQAANQYLAVLKVEPQNLLAQRQLKELRPKINDYVRNKYKEAKGLNDRGNHDKAIEVFRVILAIDPGHKLARSGIRFARGKLEKIMDVRMTRADSLAALQRWDEAVESYDRILRNEPQNQNALAAKEKVQKGKTIANLVSAGRQAGLEQNYGQALHLFEQVLEIDPNHLFARAELIRINKRIEKQVEELFNRGMDLYTQDRYQEAIRELNRVLTLNPKHRGALDYVQQAQERIAALKKLQK